MVAPNARFPKLSPPPPSPSSSPSPRPLLAMGDVAAARAQELDDRPKSSLMKKLSFLLHPKKSKPKLGSPSQKSAAMLPTPAAAAAAGSELELLFAQAEATLGQLLVRAGASFEARSASYSHADPHHHPHPPKGGDRSSTGEDDVSALISSSTGSRSAKFSGQGHARRRSLSRVWQQLGGSLFCGSGHMSAYVMDQDMMPPVPSNCLYEDTVLDEAYWQSLADAMLLQQHHQQEQHGDKQLAASADVAVHGQHELSSCRSTAKEVQNDQQQPSENQAERLHIAEGEEDRESEILPSIDADGVAKLWPPICGSTCQSSLQDMDSAYCRNLVGRESRGGCTRLNTTLDESPNLAHNYLNTKAGGGTSSGSNCYLEVNLQSDTGDEVQVQPLVPSSSSVQPLESFLWRGRSVSEPSGLASGRSSSPSSRAAPDSLTFQEPAAVESTSCRVSLMTLLHEEAAAGDSTATLDERQQEEEAEGVALVEEEGRRTRSMRVAGEDPLLCCVCMIRRKGAALIPCGHTFCRTCAKHLLAGRGACPLCNNLIVQVLDIF